MTGRKYNDADAVLQTYKQLWERLLALPGRDGRRRRLGAAAQPDDGVGPDHGRRTHGAGGREVHQRRHPRRRRRLLPGDGHSAAAGPAFSTEHDTRTSPRVVVIDERMARQFWPGEDPIGKRIRTGGFDVTPDTPWMTVVGVVGRVKQDALDADSRIALLPLPGTDAVAGDERRGAERDRSRRRWRRRSPADSRARSRSADLQDADDGGARGGVAGGAALLDAAADALRRARARPGGDRHLRRDGVPRDARGRASSGSAWRSAPRRATCWCSSSSRACRWR